MKIHTKIAAAMSLMGFACQSAIAACPVQNYDLPFTVYRQSNLPPTDVSTTFRHFPGDGYFVGSQSVGNIASSQTDAQKFFFYG